MINEVVELNPNWKLEKDGKSFRASNDGETLDTATLPGNFESETINTAAYNWSFLTDQKNKALFIDFEALGGKMNRLVVISDKKKIVIEDNHLFDLPFNTIHEIDLDKLKRGSYFVELYTYNHEIIRKAITIL